MKKLLTILFALLISGCEEEFHNSDIETLSVDYSECKNEKSGLFDEYIEKYIISFVDDGIYKIEHQNAVFNCCLTKGIAIDVYVKNDTIYFCDYEKEIGLCDCICPYDALAEVGNIESGKHVLCFKTGDGYWEPVELNFQKDMYEEILVSELTDNW